MKITIPEITITVPNLTELRRHWKWGLLVVVVMALALTLTWGGAPAAQGAHITPTVGATVPVGTTPFGVGVNAATDRVYVANQLSDDISVIDGSTNAVVATIPVGNVPFAVGVNAATDRVYVSNGMSDSVSVIGEAGATPTPTQAIEKLLDDVDNLGLPNGVANSLAASLNQATANLDDGNPNNDAAVCGNLTAFINQVDAKEQNGQLTATEAEELREAAEIIMATLGCS